ncbi:MAG: tRNA (5-methylaminomethyl-2-thiouridine)(34)-methyltransferase MnmD [Vampirovibrionales bacterium]|nr:tRNA (5-methylaminomethyl-2-thiouridine)(34)-methyltransferase MnmD [Vampirovibrionales bacterium]
MMDAPHITNLILGQPYAPDFDDVYTSTTGGVEQSRHVFIEGIELATLAHKTTPRVQIAELGVGSGLNLLLTAHTWIQQDCLPALTPVLHLYGVEAAPWTMDQLAQYYAHVVAQHPELTEIAAQWQAVYPPRMEGAHTLCLVPQRVWVTLVWGDVMELFEHLDHHGMTADNNPMDAWYLDGFAPSKNPAMWTPEVFEAMSTFSQPHHTRLATYTVASEVRRNLTTAGFALTQRPGLPPKRECLSGVFRGQGPL